MEIRRNAIGPQWVLLFITVSGALACEARPLQGQDPAPPPTSATGPASVGAGAGAVSADAGTDRPVAVPTAMLMQEVMRRWNVVVDAGDWTIDFHWNQVNQFPHPTFKFGTAEAYGEFASVLLAFFERDDDFDFLAQNHLFTTQLRADTLSGQGGVVTSFVELTDYFSSSTAFGDITPDVRNGLAQMAQRIHQTLR